MWLGGRTWDWAGAGGLVRLEGQNCERWEEVVDEEIEWNAGDGASCFLKERENILEAEEPFRNVTKSHVTFKGKGCLPFRWWGQEVKKAKGQYLKYCLTVGRLLSPFCRSVRLILLTVSEDEWGSQQAPRRRNSVPRAPYSLVAPCKSCCTCQLTPSWQWWATFIWNIHTSCPMLCSMASLQASISFTLGDSNSEFCRIRRDP